MMSPGVWSYLYVCVQAAVEKVKEADRLVSAGKLGSNDRKRMTRRLSGMSYSLQGGVHATALTQRYSYGAGRHVTMVTVRCLLQPR